MASAVLAVVSGSSGAAVPSYAVGPAPTGLAPDALPIGGAVPAVGIDESSGLVWAVAASGGKSDSVSEFSEASQSVTATFSVPPGADALAVDQQSGLVWVVSGGTGSQARQVLTEITESSGATASIDLTSASAGGRLIGVVADPGSAKVFALTSSGRLIEAPEATPGQFSVVDKATVAKPPGGLALDPADRRIWITSPTADSVSAFTESGARASGMPSAIDVGAGPGSIAIDPDTGLVWVGNLDAGTLTEIRESTGDVLAPAIKVGTGLAVVAVAPDQARPDKGVVWTAGSFLPFTFDEFSEATTPARLTASGPADPTGVPDAIAVDSTNGQLYEGTGQALAPFLPLDPVLAPQSLIFWTKEPALDSEPSTNQLYFPPPVFSMSGAPSWLRIDRFSGVFHGVPPKPGTITVTITARNSLGEHSSAEMTITINSPPVFTSPTSVTFVAGHRSRFQVVATGVPAPSFVIGGSAMPSGLTFTSTGLLSGTPAAGTEGNYQFFVGANNDPGGPLNVVQQLALHIVRGRAPAFISPSRTRIKLRAGRKATVTIKASGVPAATITVKGNPPPGLRRKHGRQGAVVLKGSPRRSDAGHSYKLSLSASNLVGHVTETLVITIG